MANLIQARDLRINNRESLVDAVPLPSPWAMFIEPTNTCNFRCKYCPTGDTALLQKMGRKNKLMTWELFTKVVEDMKQFPRKVKMTNLYKDGESLLHPRFTDMVRYLRDADVSEKIWVKTNGSTLSPEYNERLVNCGLDMIGISVQHVHAQGFYDTAGVKVDYNKYRANVLDLYRRARGLVEVSVKIADTGLTISDKEQFIVDFADRADYVAIEGLHGWSTSELKDWKLGTDQSFDGTPRAKKIACPLVLYMMTVNSNGSISVCNDDWGQLHQLGDANNDSLLNIWNGAKMRDFRMMHVTGNKHNNAACKNCDYMQVIPDNIDNDLQAIKEKL